MDETATVELIDKYSHRWFISQLRLMASRGRIDDADVQIMFEAPDQYEILLEEYVL